jgi:hypothetical protein
MTATTDTTTLRDELDIAALMTGWLHRDTGDWAQLRGLFHPEARISVTWFTGRAADFVDASARMSASALRTKHVIAAPLITFSATGNRAVTETNAVVVAENAELGLGAVTHNRFLDRVERHGGRWAIRSRDSVYDFSSFTFPRGLPAAVDPDAVAGFPVEYAALAHLLAASGFAVGDAFATRDSDRERQLKRSAAAWLAED